MSLCHCIFNLIPFTASYGVYLLTLRTSYRLHKLLKHENWVSSFKSYIIILRLPQNQPNQVSLVCFIQVEAICKMCQISLLFLDLEL